VPSAATPPANSATSPTPWSISLCNGGEIEFIDDDSDLEKAGDIAALLRFRADQNTPKKVAV